MKKLLSLVAVMLVASLTMFASAQDIVGKWSVDTNFFANIEEEGANFDMVLFTYAEDKSGTFSILMNITVSWDDTTKMRFEERVDVSYTWECSGDQLSMTTSNIDFELGDISFIPSSPEYEAAIPMLRQMFEQELDANKEQWAKEMGIISGTTTIESLTAYRMVLIYDTGERMTLIRVE